jgi:DNA-binding protein HU-beta
MAKKSARPKRTSTKAKAATRKASRGKKPGSVKTSLKPRATPAGVHDRQHLASVIQAGTGCSGQAAKRTINAVLDSVVLSLKKNKRVQFAGFGTFEVLKRRAHKGRNPATGEAIKIKASKRVRFRAGVALKRLI